MAMAIKHYRTGTVSTGKAAELAGIPKPLLLMKLGDYGIDTFDMSAEELDRELDTARRFAQDAPSAIPGKESKS